MQIVKKGVSFWTIAVPPLEYLKHLLYEFHID